MHTSRLARLALCTLALPLPLAACGSDKSHTVAGSGASAEAKSAATGDIPDNQVFLTFRNRGARYSILYPEGWARRGTGNDVTFQDKDNRIHIAVRPGSATSPRKRTFKSESAPNPVTGKRVRLTTDRYVYPGKGHVAVVDLSSPAGVDNVDAYRMISRSFKWL